MVAENEAVVEQEGVQEIEGDGTERENNFAVSHREARKRNPTRKFTYEELGVPSMVELGNNQVGEVEVSPNLSDCVYNQVASNEAGYPNPQGFSTQDVRTINKSHLPGIRPFHDSGALLGTPVSKCQLYAVGGQMDAENRPVCASVCVSNPVMSNVLCDATNPQFLTRLTSVMTAYRALNLADRHMTQPMYGPYSEQVMNIATVSPSAFSQPYTPAYPT